MLLLQAVLSDAAECGNPVRVAHGSNPCAWRALGIARCSLQLFATPCSLLLQAVREGRSALWGAAGGAILVAYGFVPTAQPILNFGRIYAGAAFPQHSLAPARCCCSVQMMSALSCTVVRGIRSGAHFMLLALGMPAQVKPRQASTGLL